MSTVSEERDRFDVAIVGAGFAGLYMLHRARSLGFSAVVLEAGGGIGGTWYWNRYPGARCDVESLEYSYQFSPELQQEWDWTERYAAQPEILKYIEHVADRFDLRRDVILNTRVRSAHFDETATLWRVCAENGGQWSSRFLIMATGCLSSPSTPDLKGLETFRGALYQTSRWPQEEIDFAGQRVAVIGTGSSAVQSIPIIAEQAEHLYVFQRTPTYVVPANNGPLDPAEQKAVKENYEQVRARAKTTMSGIWTSPNPKSALDVSDEERNREYEERWTKGGFTFLGAYSDLLLYKHANDTAAQFVRTKIARTVQDPEIAQRLMPDVVFACKRVCVGNHYYETFNRENVTLVNVRENPIQEVTPDGLTVGSRHIPIDALVLATGFDAMTGPLLKIDIKGKQGVRLRDKWAEGPRTYLGLTVNGFPNLFIITGPGSPSVLTNMIPSIEQHVEWIAECMASLRQRGMDRIEPDVAAEDAWVATVNAIANHTLFPQCNSWYLGANIPGKPRVFMPYLGFPAYAQKCAEVAAAGYAGFKMA